MSPSLKPSGPAMRAEQPMMTMPGVNPNPSLGNPTPAAERLLDVQDLTVTINPETNPVTLVSDVSFSINAGEIVGMVGESGSGKSITALSLLGLLPRIPHRVTGHALFQGVDLVNAKKKTLSRIRGDQISMIFQEPMTALDPVFTVGYQLAETVRAHRKISQKDAWRLAVDMLDAVGIPLPERRANEYPHQLSGGMRQRVMIAIALICEPKLLIADEPTTAVDVTIQAQILELIKQLSRDMGTAVLFITHDLGVVSELCEKIVTLYCGEAVESGAAKDVLTRPRHPYTSALLQSIPKMEAPKATLQLIPGRIPQPGHLPNGCLFHPRCPYATDICREERQVLRPVDDNEHTVRCVRSEELQLQGSEDHD
jgi:oligopeptide/dipeptide ABC transporter ATP-binding protein